MNVQRTPVASAVALLAISIAGAAMAQSSKPEDSGQTIEVLGIRGSLQKSLQAKRDADTRVEVITAEDIGKMPDKNVADSLQRVPGVTISSASANEGGFDENDRVSMRGTNPSLTQTLINGHGVSSGDWFVLNQTGTVGRSVSYSLLPSELVQSVVVHKSSEASLVEGGVAGSVDIITRKPLQFRNQFTAEGNVGLVYADLPGKTDPQVSGLFNWKNTAGTVGVLVQAFYEKRHLRRDGQELLGYEQIASGSAMATAHPDLAGVYYPVLIGSALFEQERTRTGGLIDVQLKPMETLSLDFSGFASTMRAPNYNRNYMLWGTHVLNTGAGQSPDPGYLVRNNTLVSANFTPVAGSQYGIYDQISRPDAKSDSSFFNFDARWAVNDKLTLSSKLGTTRGNGETPTQDVAEWNTGVGTGAGWHLNGIGSAADWNLGSQNNSSPAGTSLSWIFGDQNVKVKDKETWGQIDGEYGLDAGAFTILKFGARATDHSRESGDIIGQGPNFAITPGPFDPSTWPKGSTNYPSDYADGLGGNFPRNVWYYTADQLHAFNSTYANRPTDGSREDWASEFGLKEKTAAAYLQADFEARNFGGNVGLRAVRTKEEVTNNVAASPTTPGAITASAFGPFIPMTVSHTYTDWLPSANLKWKLGADQVLRFALSKTMTRPDYSALAGAVNLTPPAAPGATGTGSGGNPDLKPIRSTNFDTNWEWYFAPRALLSAGAFYMDLNSYVGFGHVTKQYMTFNAANPNGFIADYNLTVPINSSGKVKGVELAWEQPLFTNFGASANYTYADANESGGGPLVGASQNTYNLIGYYEDDRFNFRVAYNYRSSFYSGLDRSTAFYQAATSNLGASIGYKFSETISVSLDGRNLNDPKLKYYALTEDQPRSVYQNGRQYFLTLRARI